MKARHFFIRSVVLLCVTAFVTGSVSGISKAVRLSGIGLNMRQNIRYLVENGETVGETAATEALAAGYLESIFGENQQLVDRLKNLVHEGLSEAPSLNLGQVAAMMVTYRLSDERQVSNVCAYVMGSFPEGRRKVAMHRDGYFQQFVDNQLWNLGNTAISFMGRDMVLFADEAVVEEQQAIMESVFSGEIEKLVENISPPMYFSLVFPDPHRVLPPQLRNHVQAIVVKGMMSPYEGRLDVILLTPSPRSSSYVLAAIDDMKRVTEYSLKTKWKGVIVETAWGEHMENWWAYEALNASQSAVLEKEYNIVRIKSEFERKMVNVILKGVERMGRDVAQIRASKDYKLDPRLVQARLRGQRRGLYWSDAHASGPDWPIGPAED